MKGKIYEGIISEISEVDPYKTGHKKRLVKLQEEGQQSSWIEFRGNLMELLEGFKTKDQVIIKGLNKGSHSKYCHHNNIVAKSIVKC